MAIGSNRKIICVFVDGANLYFTSQKLGFDMDYDKLLQYFKKRFHLLRIYYYTAVYDPVPGQVDRLRPVLDWMHYNGYSVVTKRTKQFTDRDGLTKTKGNMDMEIAVDAMLMAPHMDEMFLLSGDGDFTYLVNKIKALGVRVSVVSTVETQPAMIADELRREADEFIDLHELMDQIMREPSTKSRERL